MKIFNKYKETFLCGLGLLMLSSCSMVNEDMDPCAQKPNTFVHVDFVYDYNMLREDLFDAHAGTAHLYVFDEDSVFLFDRAVSKNDMKGGVDFSMTFDTLYFVPGKKYMMVAMAQGNHSGYDWSCVSTPGFQIPIDREMIPGVSKISDYRIKLDRDGDSYADLGLVDYKDAYNENKQLMDTLWSTKPHQVQNVDVPYVEWVQQIDTVPDNHIYVKMPMMRITNAITVNVVHDTFDETTDLNDFNVLIDFPNGNGTIGFTGTVDPIQRLIYKSLRKKLVTYQPKQNGAQYNQTQSASDTKSGVSTRANGEETHAIQTVFGVSRLLTTDGSALQVWNSDFSQKVCEIGGTGDESFSQWLANYFNSHLEDQEFLDREYDFTIDVHLKDGKLWYVQVGCSILGWGKRVFDYIPR